MSLRNKILFTDKISNIRVIKAITQVADSENLKVFAVGGFVRDLILGREKNDLDVLVIGSGVDFAQSVAEKLGITNVNYFKNFGTAHFDYDNMNIEFVGARKESYDRNTRKPIVEDGTFEDDITRRDFTINTLAISLNKSDFGKLIDNCSGFTDIENKLIKTPLDP
ncbi:MAG: tRNA nucleotidyltransferase, partial [Ignavibacteriaceae bacterium]